MKAKPKLEATRSSRKELEALEAFVEGGTKSTKRKSDGAQKLRQTFYLDEALLKRLGFHCVETRRSLSDVAAEAIEAYLKGRPK